MLFLGRTGRAVTLWVTCAVALALHAACGSPAGPRSAPATTLEGRWLGTGAAAIAGPVELLIAGDGSFTLGNFAGSLLGPDTLQLVDRRSGDRVTCTYSVRGPELTLRCRSRDPDPRKNTAVFRRQ